MHNRACFWKPFGSEPINESQKLLKSAERFFYPTFSLFWAQLSQGKLFLIRSEISGLLVNTLTANYEYSRSNREYLPFPTQIKLSKKPWIFSKFFFFCIFGIYIKFLMLRKKHEPHRWSISEFIYSQRCVYLNG